MALYPVLPGRGWILNSTCGEETRPLPQICLTKNTLRFQKTGIVKKLRRLILHENKVQPIDNALPIKGSSRPTSATKSSIETKRCTRISRPPVRNLMKKVCYVFNVLWAFSIFDGRSIDNQLLVALNTIGSQQPHPTEATNKAATTLLDYMATYSDDRIIYRDSDMIVSNYADVDFHNETKGRIHFYLWKWHYATIEWSFSYHRADH